MEHTIGSVSLFDVAASPTHIALSNVDFPTNAEVSDDDSGSPYAEVLSLTNFAPVGNLTTKAIASFLTFSGAQGQCVGAGLDITQADVISRAIETCKDPLGATPHLRERVTTGFLEPSTLTADRGADATIEGMLHTFTDGANAPVARTDGVALPTPIVHARYTLGKCKFAGIVFDNMDGINLSFGLVNGDKTPSHGSIWPDSMPAGIAFRPILTIRNRAVAKVIAGQIELGATEGAHANSVIQLIQRKSSGSFMDFGGNNHIRITIAGLITPDNLITASPNQRATNSISFRGGKDGSGNSPIILSLATTYDDTP